jgi:hypothetical protein
LRQCPPNPPITSSKGDNLNPVLNERVYRQKIEGVYLFIPFNVKGLGKQLRNSIKNIAL